eukprot:COSAG06_NODE_7287_length_2559_cov_2.642683_2_plen_129_part_00
MKVPQENVGAHGVGSAPGRRRVSRRAGRCRGAPRLTKLRAPRMVALATASITSFPFFGGKKLAGLGLDQYRSNFEEQSISGDALLELSASDLQGVGSLRIERLGHRKLLTKAISQLQHRSESDLSLAL